MSEVAAVAHDQGGAPRAAGASVCVIGASGGLGDRVIKALAEAGSVVVADDQQAARVAVHLGAGDHDARARRRESITEGVVAALETATRRGAEHFVLVSSAMVYGAWPNNAVPITEDAILRPDVEFVYARQLAAAEALVDRWRRQRSGRTVTVLRPVVAVAADGTSQLARALVAGFGQRFAAEDPPTQFLHLDDLASAVTVAVDRRLDGAYNVAPDGWIAGDRVRALSGERLRIQLPDRPAQVLAALRWRFQRGPIPPGLRSYTRAPWVVANDKLKSVGWQPTVTNEQAYVEGTEAKWWTMVSPGRRQELALGGMIAGIAAAVLATVLLIRRWRR